MSLTPLHTRMVSLRLTWGEAGTLVAAARIFDLRKRGLVPLGGKLQGPGVVHDMAVRLRLPHPGPQDSAHQTATSALPLLPRAGAPRREWPPALPCRPRPGG